MASKAAEPQGTEEFVVEEEIELLEDEADEVEPQVVQVEFVGDKIHGNTLHRRRILTRADAKAGWGLTLKKDLEWNRENGFKLNVEDNPALTPEVLERLAEDPKFKLHRQG
jgi:hypothetical protein